MIDSNDDSLDDESLILIAAAHKSVRGWLIGLFFLSAISVPFAVYKMTRDPSAESLAFFALSVGGFALFFSLMLFELIAFETARRMLDLRRRVRRLEGAVGSTHNALLDN